MLGLSGKRVLVTGASKGIGAATARLFAQLGAEVAVGARFDGEPARAVCADVRAAGVRAELFTADLSLWAEGERLVAEVEDRMGPIDAAVLNHGIWKKAPIDAMTEQDYAETVATNLGGYVSVAGALARRMKPRRAGRLVLVSSTAGQRGEAEYAHYASTKGAIISLTKSLSSELAPSGVAVNCVAPGWVGTTMTEHALGDGPERARILAAIPVGRVAAPEEIAWPIAFLASARASFVTGEIFNVNGGAVLAG